MCLCMYARVCVCIRRSERLSTEAVSSLTHTHKVYSRTHKLTHIHAHMYTCTHACTCTHTHTNVSIHTHIATNTYNIHPSHAHTRIHTHTHSTTHTHTHIDLCVYASVWGSRGRPPPLPQPVPWMGEGGEVPPVVQDLWGQPCCLEPGVCVYVCACVCVCMCLHVCVCVCVCVYVYVHQLFDLCMSQVRERRAHLHGYLLKVAREREEEARLKRGGQDELRGGKERKLSKEEKER